MAKKLKQPIGIWVMTPEGKPELIRETSVRVARAQRAIKHEGRKYNHKPFLARITASGGCGERISSTPVKVKSDGSHHGSAWIQEGIKHYVLNTEDSRDA